MLILLPCRGTIPLKAVEASDGIFLSLIWNALTLVLTNMSQFNLTKNNLSIAWWD